MSEYKRLIKLIQGSHKLSLGKRAFGKFQPFITCAMEIRKMGRYLLLKWCLVFTKTT